jgi:SWI/SNF-related matrix-associated actin-dependent regulator 1 of chromatin subfamily A
MLDWISNTIQDHKLVVFANHRKIVDDIYEYFKNDAVRYYGGMSQEQKTKAKEDFLNNKKLFIGNIISAGTGLDGLQKECNNVAFVELPWTAAQFDQATDRLWRGGQKNNVNVYVLMAKDSVEERIMAVLDKSREIVESIIDGKETQEINLLSEVMKSYKKS